MEYLPYIIILSINSLASFVFWTIIRLKDLRRQLTLVNVGLSAQKLKTQRISQKLPGLKPNIGSTPRLDDACELRVANGTPILVMPNGEILPNQMDLSFTQPISGGRQLPKVTVTMLVNVEDSLWLPPTKDEAKPSQANPAADDLHR